MSDLTKDTSVDLQPVREAAERFAASVGKVIVGKREIVDLFFVALLCEGHVLVEDVPGIGKTMFARAVARSLGCSFKRIQSTPDLLPSDVTGIHYFNQKTSEFEFRPGPIVANIVLVDEINRATPRTQSCLLESMQERQITVDLETVPLPRPFLVIATQNPVELEGTFPLPEAQLDRFLFRLEMGYPSDGEEGSIMERFQQDNPLDTLNSVIASDELLELGRLCRQVYIDESVRSYIIAISRATRAHEGVRLGASPRASLGLYMASQALAAVRGRNYVLPDDVKYLAVPALAHRLIPQTEARLRGRTAEAIVREVINSIPVPVEEQTQQ
jgi:MoxR-like ATPase